LRKARRPQGGRLPFFRRLVDEFEASFGAIKADFNRDETGTRVNLVLHKGGNPEKGPLCIGHRFAGGFSKARLEGGGDGEHEAHGLVLDRDEAVVLVEAARSGILGIDDEGERAQIAASDPIDGDLSSLRRPAGTA
jgi:hypothetical protein